MSVGCGAAGREGGSVSLLSGSVVSGDGKGGNACLSAGSAEMQGGAGRFGSLGKLPGRQDERLSGRYRAQGGHHEQQQEVGVCLRECGGGWLDGRFE